MTGKLIMIGGKILILWRLDENRHTLSHLEDEPAQGSSGSSILLISGKELLQEVQKEKDLHFALIGKPKVILTSTS